MDALVRGARMLCRVVEERGVEDALSEAQEAVKIAKEVVEDEKEGLEGGQDRVLRARVYKAVGIVEALSAAKGASVRCFYSFLVGSYVGFRVGADDPSNETIRGVAEYAHVVDARSYKRRHVLPPRIHPSRSARNSRRSPQRPPSSRTRTAGRTRMASPRSAPHSYGRLGRRESGY